MVDILTTVLSDGLPAVEAACAEALKQGVHSADVILNILARRREPAAAIGQRRYVSVLGDAAFSLPFPTIATTMTHEIRGRPPSKDPSPVMQLARCDRDGVLSLTRYGSNRFRLDRMGDRRNPDGDVIIWNVARDHSIRSNSRVRANRYLTQQLCPGKQGHITLDAGISAALPIPRTCAADSHLLEDGAPLADDNALTYDDAIRMRKLQAESYLRFWTHHAPEFSLEAAAHPPA